MKTRCAWANPKNQLYIDYHDTEWGVPVTDDRKLFEFITLEGAQAGLSWETILNRRDGFCKAFENFDVQKVAKISENRIEQLLQNQGIIRNRLKVASTVKNAQAYLKIQNEFGTFATYIWSFVDYTPIQNQPKDISEVPPVTELAVTISKDLKKRGFSFVGPTIVYAFMQACGLVNDHTTDCFRHAELQKMNKSVSL